MVSGRCSTPSQGDLTSGMTWLSHPQCHVRILCAVSVCKGFVWQDSCRTKWSELILYRDVLRYIRFGKQHVVPLGSSRGPPYSKKLRDNRWKTLLHHRLPQTGFCAPHSSEVVIPDVSCFCLRHYLIAPQRWRQSLLIIYEFATKLLQIVLRLV